MGKGSDLNLKCLIYGIRATKGRDSRSFMRIGSTQLNNEKKKVDELCSAPKRLEESRRRPMRDTRLELQHELLPQRYEIGKEGR